MSTPRVAEHSAAYALQTAVEPAFGASFDLLATAPQGVAKLRELILSLAVRGRLSALDQNRVDNSLSTVLRPAGGDGTDISWLPLDWRAITLSQLGQWAVGSGFPTVEQGRQGLSILFAKVSDMNLQGNEKEIVATNNTIDVETASRLRINVHPPGTVVFPKIGGAIATNKRRLLVCPTAIDNNCLGIIPNSSCSSAYLYLLLKSFDFTQYQVGTSVPALNQGTLGEIPVGLPPLAEQARIVARVEELMQLCDALEAHGRLQDEQHARLVATLFDILAASASAEALAENWQRIATHFDLLLDRPEAVDALEQTLLQLAVRGLLVPQNSGDERAVTWIEKFQGDDVTVKGRRGKLRSPPAPIENEECHFVIPSSWAWARFATVAKIASDLVDPSGFQNVAQVAPDCIEKSTGRLVKKRSVKQSGVISANHRFYAGQILYSKIRPSLSKVIIVDFDGLCSADMYPIDTDMDSGYLHLFMLSDCFLTQVKDAENRVKMPKLNQEALNAFHVAVPPLAEQHRIVAHVEQLRRLCAELRERLQQARATQSRLADVLVSAAAQSPTC